MTSARIGAIVVALAAAAVLCAAAAGTTPRVLLGVLGDPGRFQQLTGQASDTRLLIVGWGQGATYGSPFPELFQTMGAVPMLGLSTGLRHGGEVSHPRQIALGSGDSYLVAVNHALHAFGKRIFFRPFAEMNGHWNPYSAYNANGTPRDAGHSTAVFRAAFARTYLIAHGGPRVTSVLRARPAPVRGTLFANLKVQVIWNPQEQEEALTSPATPRRPTTRRRLVDVVGDDRSTTSGSGPTGQTRRPSTARIRGSRSRSRSGRPGTSTIRSSSPTWRRG